MIIYAEGYARDRRTGRSRFQNFLLDWINTAGNLNGEG